MTDQPNAEALESVKDESTNPEQNAEAGTAKEADQEVEKPSLDYEKIIAEKAFEARKAKREKKELEERLKSLEQQKEPELPSVPDVPDRYDFDTDEEYKEAINKRDQALIERNRYEFSKQQAEDEKKKSLEAEQENKNRELREKLEVYSSRAAEFKIEPSEMAQIGERLEVYDIRQDIAEAILGDEEGPLIAKYLASNPQKVQELNETTWQNGALVYAKVKESASALKPKVTSAPEPVDTLNGGANIGTGDSKYKFW